MTSRRKPTAANHRTDGAVTNFKIGLGIEVVRAIISNIGLLQKSPLNIFSVLKNMESGLMLFLVGYTTIYRATLCALNRHHQKQTGDSMSIAALSAGSAYFLYPNFTILAHGIISSIKMLWYRFILSTKPKSTAMENNTSDDRPYVERLGQYLDSLPLGKCFYVLSIGYVFHMRTFYPWMCPSILLKAVHYTSGMNADPAMLRLTEYLLGYKTSVE